MTATEFNYVLFGIQSMALMVIMAVGERRHKTSFGEAVGWAVFFVLCALSAMLTIIGGTHVNGSNWLILIGNSSCAGYFLWLAWQRRPPSKQAPRMAGRVRASLHRRGLEVAHERA
jgi:threonine/homoserine/homoserine lactone efflux protein